LIKALEEDDFGCDGGAAVCKCIYGTIKHLQKVSNQTGWEKLSPPSRDEPPPPMLNVRHAEPLHCLIDTPIAGERIIEMKTPPSLL
jgi:hypothetical protein